MASLFDMLAFSWLVDKSRSLSLCPCRIDFRQLIGQEVEAAMLFVLDPSPFQRRILDFRRGTVERALSRLGRGPLTQLYSPHQVLPHGVIALRPADASAGQRPGASPL